MNMKKMTIKHSYRILPAALIVCLCILPQGRASAQVPVAEVIRQGVKKVIVAVDLKIQRLQNETIWLQNAQKVLENQLSKLKLSEIADWTERQRDLYAKYYEDLWKVKTAITYYREVRDLTSRSALLVEEYQRAWNLVRQDRNFSPTELEYMLDVYTGILAAGARNVDQLELVVRSFSTRMSDADRMKLLQETSEQMDVLRSDLREFNRQNMLLSLGRAKTGSQVRAVRALYGLQQGG